MTARARENERRWLCECVDASLSPALGPPSRSPSVGRLPNIDPTNHISIRTSRASTPNGDVFRGEGGGGGGGERHILGLEGRKNISGHRSFYSLSTIANLFLVTLESCENTSVLMRRCGTFY